MQTFPSSRRLGKAMLRPSLFLRNEPLCICSFSSIPVPPQNISPTKGFQSQSPYSRRRSITRSQSMTATAPASIEYETRGTPHTTTSSGSMPSPIYVAATRQHVGKTSTSLALLSGLQKRFPRVGFMKPVGQQSAYRWGTVVTFTAPFVR